MTLTPLIGSAAILILTVLGLSVLLFGRDWIRTLREEKFQRRLTRYSGLVTRLRTPSAGEFEGEFRQL